MVLFRRAYLQKGVSNKPFLLRLETFFRIPVVGLRLRNGAASDIFVILLHGTHDNQAVALHGYLFMHKIHQIAVFDEKAGGLHDAGVGEEDHLCIRGGGVPLGIKLISSP